MVFPSELAYIKLLLYDLNVKNYLFYSCNQRMARDFFINIIKMYVIFLFVSLNTRYLFCKYLLSSWIVHIYLVHTCTTYMYFIDFRSDTDTCMSWKCGHERLEEGRGGVFVIGGLGQRNYT